MRADRGQIEQVLLNLVINARDAMPNGGALRIAVGVVDVAAAVNDIQREPLPHKHVCLSVADSGHGMDAQTASRIFEPFFTTKGVGEGTGDRVEFRAERRSRRSNELSFEVQNESDGVTLCSVWRGRSACGRGGLRTREAPTGRMLGP